MGRVQRLSSPFLLFLLPAIATALTDLAPNPASALNPTVAERDATVPNAVVDELAAPKVSPKGTLDAPVDGKDGRPHAGPWVETNAERDRKKTGTAKTEEQADTKSTEHLGPDGKPIPYSNDGVMDDPHRTGPKEGTRGTEGGVSEKQKGSTNPGEKVPDSPKEAPPLPHSEQQKAPASEEKEGKTSDSKMGVVEKPADLPEKPHDIPLPKSPPSVNDDPLGLNTPKGSSGKIPGTPEEPHSDLCRAILWRIPRLERLRADNITHGERPSHERTGECALRVSGTVGHRPLVENGQRRDDRIDQVNANQDAGLVMLRQERHKRAADDAGNSAEDEPSPAVGNPADTDPDGQRKEDTDDARRCVQQCRLYIPNRLPDLPHIDPATPHPRLVHADMSQQRDLLALAQPPRLHRRIGNEKHRQHADQHRNQSQDEKHNPPPRKRVMHLLERKRDNAAEYLRHAEPEVPEGESRGLFAARVELAAEKHERGSDSRFEDAKEDSRHEQAPVIMGAGRGSCRDTPERHIQAEPFCGGGFLEEVHFSQFISVPVFTSINQDSDSHEGGMS
ncbi:hypothetical protein APSETT445_004550 [Aspergillus pseudonomiae]